LKVYKFATKVIFILGITCYVSLLSLMPLMHDHEHEDVHCHEHGHEESESSHTEESCLACVFINTYADNIISPTFNTSPIHCCETPTIKEINNWTYRPTANYLSRAPPIFSNYTSHS